MGMLKDLISLNLLLLFVFLIAVIEAIPWLIPMLICLAVLKWVIWPCLRAVKLGFLRGWREGKTIIRKEIEFAKASDPLGKTATLDKTEEVPDFLR